MGHPLRESCLNSAPIHRLFQQAVDFDFASGGEVDAAVDDEWEDKPRGQGRSVALAVLFLGVDRLVEVGCVEGIEDGRLVVRAVPGLGRDGPDDSVLVAVGGDRRCGSRIRELHG
jgi:hypothetical protein